jgi:hypothetical protein
VDGFPPGSRPAPSFPGRTQSRSPAGARSCAPRRMTEIDIVLPSDAASRSRGAIRPSFASKPCPSEIRGRREDRVRAAPAVSCAICTKESAHEHTGSAGASRPSLRNGFTTYIALSPATNSSCHRRLRIKTCPSPVGPTRLHRLDISNGCQAHTVLPYASTSVVCVPPIAHGPFANPPCHRVSRPTLPRPLHPIPRS